MIGISRTPRDLPDPVELSRQLRGHRRTLGLVLLEHLVSEGRGGRVEGEDDMGRVPVGEGTEQAVQEPVDRADLLAGAPDVQRLPDGVPGPVDQGMTVQKHQQRPLREHRLRAVIGHNRIPGSS